MTAVIYARYSSDNQREESIEGQIRECTAYAEKNGITVVKHYIDRALSAKTDNRPDFQQMIKDSEKRLFDIVLVWKLDRFARNRYDSAHYEYQLERNHVKLVSATEPISDSPAGIMVKSMLTGMAEYYSAELSEKVVRGMTENVLKGKYNGGTIPIGYTVDEEKFFQIDPLKAPFVVEAFQRYNDGATMKELMNWLNDSGVTTNRNQKFTYNSIQTLLTNRRYIGENRFKDIVMPDSIPVIIEKELFDSVQDKIAKNRRAPARHKAEDDYLLTTKLFCGMCGAMMFGECGTSRNKNVHHYYKCANAKRTKTCKKKTVRKEWLEDLVVNETMKMIRDDDCIRSIVDAVMILQEQENTVLPLLEKQMKDIERGIENLLNAIQEGILTSSTKGRLEKLEAQQKELEIRIAEEKLAKPKVSADFVKFWLTNFRKLDPNVKSHRETLINTFVNAVYLYDEKVLITFNYKDGTKTITFDEIAAKDAPEGNGSDLGCFAPPNSLYPNLILYEKGFGYVFVYWRFAPATERSCAARWRGLNPTSSCGDTARNGKQERATAGYHHGDGILPFVLYGAFGGNRCVRAYRGEPVYLWQGVITLDFVPKSVCQGAAPLWNLCGACTHIRSETTKSYSILSITTLVPLATTPIILFAKVM